MNNHFGIVGRITKDIELRYTTNNKAVCEVNIAINNGKDDTTFLPITIFGKVAETTSQYCKKGDLVGVSGIIKNHNWEDKEGKKRYDYSFIASKVSFLTTKIEKIKEEVKEDKFNKAFEEFGNDHEDDLNMELPF